MFTTEDVAPLHHKCLIFTFTNVNCKGGETLKWFLKFADVFFHLCQLKHLDVAVYKVEQTCQKLL